MRNDPPYRLLLPLILALCLGAFLISEQSALGILGPYDPAPPSLSSLFAPVIPGGDPLEQPWLGLLPTSAGPGTIGLLLQRATVRRLIYGGIVVVGDHGGILSVTSRGRVDSSSSALPIDQHTIFDLASLTKVVATAPAVMKLVDQGRISLSDPLSRWFPEFRNSRHTITVQQLLTHTSGLADRHLLPHQTIHGVALRAAKKQEMRAPGSHFQYADINFILLAELVHRVSGKPLDVFCREELYAPLGMGRTMFRPPRAVFEDLAPSTDFGKGVPQDREARRLGGVAGHAGLFSSASDLSRYARFMLGRGSLEGHRVLSEGVIAKMTAPHPCGRAGVERGLGWDIDSPFSSPKGTLLSEKSFGHTGYSGSSIWIDPESDLFVIILTNRRDFHGAAAFNQFRRDVSTVAAAQFGDLAIGSSLTALQRVQSEVSRVTARCLLSDIKDRREAAARHRSLDRKAKAARSHIRGHGHSHGPADAASVHRHRKIANAGHGGHRKGQHTHHRG